MDVLRVPAYRFVCFDQDHDQIGNRATGDRIAATLAGNPHQEGLLRIAAGLGSLALPALVRAPSAFAQAKFPDHTMRLVIPFAPAGPTAAPAVAGAGTAAPDRREAPAVRSTAFVSLS